MNLSLHASTDRIVPGPFQLLFGDALLDQILGGVDRVRVAGDGHDTVSGTGREDTLFGDLDVGAAQLLDLDQ